MQLLDPPMYALDEHDLITVERRADGGIRLKVGSGHAAQLTVDLTLDQAAQLAMAMEIEVRSARMAEWDAADPAVEAEAAEPVDPLAHVKAGDHPDPTWLAPRGATESVGFCDEGHEGYLCTRQDGHPGQHIAGTSTEVAEVWPALDVPRPRRLATPTSRLVWSGDPLAQRPEWLAVRQRGIGSSDVSKIVCPSGHGTALDVWADKVRDDRDDDEPSEAARWGSLLEDVVAREWAHRTGLSVSRIGVVEHVEHSWMRAAVDRRVHGCERATRGCPLEVKTRNQYVAGRWVEDIPDDVLAQVQWQLLVTGWDHAHVACLIGGQRLLTFDVDADPDVQALCFDEAEKVWAAVVAGVVPEIDPETADRRVADALDRLLAHVEGSVEVGTDAIRYLGEYLAARDLEKSAKQAKESAGAALATLLAKPGEDEPTVMYDTALVEGVVAYTRKPVLRSTTDTKRLAAEWPEVAEQVISKKPTAPVLRIAAAFDLKESTS